MGWDPSCSARRSRQNNLKLLRCISCVKCSILSSAKKTLCVFMCAECMWLFDIFHPSWYAMPEGRRVALLPLWSMARGQGSSKRLLSLRNRVFFFVLPIFLWRNIFLSIFELSLCLRASRYGCVDVLKTTGILKEFSTHKFHSFSLLSKHKRLKMCVTFTLRSFYCQEKKKSKPTNEIEHRRQFFVLLSILEASFALQKRDEK